MCNRHSFLLSRAGKVLDGFGITDSHAEIRELHGLKHTDDTVNAINRAMEILYPDWNTDKPKSGMKVKVTVFRG